MTPRFSFRRYLPWAASFLFIGLLFFNFCGTGYEVPVLMYHHVDYSASGDSSSTVVTPQTFERQMEFLKLHRYRVMELSELIRRVKAGERIPSKTVSITFDDGYLDNFTNAFPVLKKMRFTATIFVISSNVGREGWLSEEDLRILDGSQIAIGSHTAHHAFLPDLSREEAKKELTDSKAALEKILMHPVTLFSYPAGGLTPDTQTLVKEAGYEGAVTTNYGQDRRDPYALHRIKVSDASGNLFNFWSKVSGYYLLGKKRVQAKA